MDLKPQFPKLDVNLSRLSSVFETGVVNVLKGIFRDLFRMLENLHNITCQVVNANTAAPVWTPITLEANWTNYNASHGVSTCEDSAWTKDERGIITLRGLVDHTGSGVSTYILKFASNPGMAGPDSGHLKIYAAVADTTFARIDVDSIGVIFQAGTAIDYTSLQGVSWETR